MTAAPRQQLLSLLAARSFRLGQFTLSSGARSDYYIDCRVTTLHAEGARLTARVFMDALQSRGWTADAVGGLTLGADPIVVAVAMLSAQQVQSRERARLPEKIDGPGLIHGFIVRKGEKSHGTGQRIEGFCQPDARAVIVDDVCTTGASTVQAIEAARAAGMKVIGVICLVEREEAGGRVHVEKAAAPAPFVSIFQAAEVREEHLRLQRQCEIG